VKAAEQGGEAEEGFLEFAVAGRGGRGGGAGLVVGEDGADDGGEVAAGAGAVVHKFLGHAVDVGGAGVVGDEALDELAADEGRGVGVVEEGVEEAFEVFGAAEVGGDDGAGGTGGADDGFGGGFVVTRVEDHRVDVVLAGGAEIGGGGGGREETEAGENLGGFGDGGLVVGGDGRP
jgi:hypothetical protein